MPTTLTGLVLFVVLLLPGFAYLVGKERHGTERQASPFRETVAIVAASVTSEIVVLGLFSIIRWQWPAGTPDVARLLRSPGAYLAGTGTAPTHYAIVGLWGLGLLIMAMALAYAATVPSVRQVASKLPLVAPYPHESTVSGWWMLFEKWRDKRPVEVGCVLDDGSYVSGTLGSFNTSANDTPERDLILWAPILYRPPGADEPIAYETASAASVTASRIVTMFVGYLKPPGVSPPETIPAGVQAVERREEEAAAEPKAVPQTGSADHPSSGRPCAPSPHPRE
jgi:hypothetical protein